VTIPKNNNDHGADPLFWKSWCTRYIDYCILDQRSEDVCKRIQPTLHLDHKYNRAGVIHGGHQSQFNLLRQKLLTDTLNITIRTIGGSITRGATPTGVVTYPTWLQSYLNDIFKTDRFSVENLAHGGIHPFHAQCDILDTTYLADIYIIEYAVNGWGSNHNWSYEGLLRTIRRDNPNAVIICFGAFWWFDAGVANNGFRPYNLTPILEEASIAKYYDVTYISAREALYYSDKAKKWDWISGDGLHPNSLGQSYYASLIASFIFKELATVANPPSKLDALGTALYSENLHHMIKCFRHSELVSLKNSSTSGSFNLHDDSNNGDMKDGLTANACEDWVRFSIPASYLPFDGRMVFHVLKGWHNIANITATCIDGCSCMQVEFDANFDKRHTTEVVPFFVPYMRQSNESCIFMLKTQCDMNTDSANKTHQRIAAISISNAVQQPFQVNKTTII
jgi:hypothetical protein